jgi:hypothetical protein
MGIKIINSELSQQENAGRLRDESEARIEALARTLESEDIDWDSERVDDLDERGLEQAHLAHSRNELDEILAEAARREALEKGKKARR